MNEIENKKFNKELFSLAIPLALQNLLSALVGASDALMLGRLSQDAIAAVSLANQVSFVMSLFSFSVIGAISVLIAQYWGKGDSKNVRRFLGMAIRYVFVISFLFFILAHFMPEMLMRIFTKEESLIVIGSDYLRIVSFSYLFSGIAQCFLMLMKVSGNANMSVRISAVTVMIDMSVDFFLIYGIGPFPFLGANGSAYSTIAVEIVAMLWSMLWVQRKTKIGFDRELLTFFSKDYEEDLWKVLPGMLASSLSWGLSMTVHSIILGHLGSDATAASSVTSTVQQLIQCITQGLSGGAGIMIGQLLGNNEFDRAKQYGENFWKVSFYSGLFNILLIAIIGPLAYFFYVLEPTAKSYLVQMLIFSAVYMFAYAYNTIITCGVFPAGGDSRYDAISVLIATWCLAIPLSLLACFVLRLPVMVVYALMCIDEIVKAPLIRRRYDQFLWLKNLTRGE